MSVNEEPGHGYLGRFRGVEPPRELRARILEAACSSSRRARSRDRWLLSVAALLLVLFTAVNVHVEERLRALGNGERTPVAETGNGALIPELARRAALQARLAALRPPRLREESWLRLRAEIESTENKSTDNERIGG